jgi:hypothetical protein
VAEQDLQAAQVRIVRQQVRGEGVAQDVRADARRVQPGGQRRVLEDQADGLAGDMAAGGAGGEQPAGFAPRLRPRLGGGEHGGAGAGGDRHQPFLVALAAHGDQGRVRRRAPAGRAASSLTRSPLL